MGYVETPLVVQALKKNNFPYDLVDLPFENFISKLSSKVRQELFDWVTTDFLSYSPEIKKCWLYLHGDLGTYKSVTAVGVAKFFYDKRKDLVSSLGNGEVLYHNSSVLFDWLRDFQENSLSKSSEWNRILNSSLLVLDDFLTQSDSVYVFTKIYQLFDHRYGNGYPTVITSNYPPAGVVNRILAFLDRTQVAVEKDEVVLLANRIARRLSDRSKAVSMDR